MKTTRFLASALALALLSTLDPKLSTSFAQGSLTPPGPPAPTMKSLDQIEARTPISSAPFSITNPGSYYLATNITIANGNCITIDTNGVTLDLNGFTVSSGASFNFGSAIVLASNLRDIAISNGHIRGGVTNNGSGVYSGKGFANGITYALNAPANVLVSHVTISGCGNFGIDLNTNNSTVVESCTVQTVGSEGIFASIVKQSSATDCGGDGIFGDQVSDCRGISTGTGVGIVASSSALNCNGASVGGDGIDATVAQNCYGYSNGNGSDGLFVNVAQNCLGFDTAGGNGILAEIAQNCEGLSSSGAGVSAYLANVCTGSSTTGVSISVTHNVNCF